MIPIDEKSIDHWLEDFRAFNYDFKKFCFMQMRAFSVHAEFASGALENIHAAWKRDCEDWLENETHPSTSSLSHIKIAALLLANLNKPFLLDMYDYEYKDAEPVELAISEEKAAAARADLVDGREAVLALDFCLAVVDWFESNRVDRKSAYHISLTEDMRHDLLVYLLGEPVDKKAVYLILKALFTRANGGGAAN